jgi:hypothetical protein
MMNTANEIDPYLTVVIGKRALKILKRVLARFSFRIPN